MIVLSRLVTALFAVLACATNACAQAVAAPVPESPTVLKDGGRVVFVDGSGGAFPDGVIERFGDRIRDTKKGLRVELWTVKLSGEHVLSRTEWDILGKNPTHIVVIPGADWGSEQVGNLLGKLEGESRCLVLFWPEAQPAPIAIRGEDAAVPAPASAQTLPPILLLPASLIGKGVPEVVEALGKLLGV